MDSTRDNPTKTGIQSIQSRSKLMSLWKYKFKVVVIADEYVNPLSLRGFARRFRLPSLHILHVRFQFCVIRAVRRNLQFLPV